VPAATPLAAANSQSAHVARSETYFFCSVFLLAFDVDMAISVSSGCVVCVSVAVPLALSVSVPSRLRVGRASAFAVLSVVLTIRVVPSPSVVPAASVPGRLAVMAAVSVVMVP